MELYTIRDRVAEESGPLFEAKNKGIAIRQITKMLEGVPKASLGDYKLLYMGTYNSSAMRIEVEKQPKEIPFLQHIIEYRKQMEN